MRRSVAPIVGASIALALLGAARSASADPTTTGGLTIGAAGEGLDRRIWRRTTFHMGLRADVLFLRNAVNDFGIGPYAEVLTHAFDQVQFGGGVSGLLPVIATFPIVLSVGAYGRYGDDKYGLEPGVAGTLFWGARGYNFYNFHSPYVMTAGLVAQMRYGLGPSRETSIVIAAQIDLGIMALPTVFLINALRGGSRDATPLP
jgi:hypothetical protein